MRKTGQFGFYVGGFRNDQFDSSDPSDFEGVLVYHTDYKHDLTPKRLKKQCALCRHKDAGSFWSEVLSAELTLGHSNYEAH